MPYCWQCLDSVFNLFLISYAVPFLSWFSWIVRIFNYFYSQFTQSVTRSKAKAWIIHEFVNAVDMKQYAQRMYILRFYRCELIMITTLLLNIFPVLSAQNVNSVHQRKTIKKVMSPTFCNWKWDLTWPEHGKQNRKGDKKYAATNHTNREWCFTFSRCRFYGIALAVEEEKKPPWQSSDMMHFNELQCYFWTLVIWRQSSLWPFL